MDAEIVVQRVINADTGERTYKHYWIGSRFATACIRYEDYAIIDTWGLPWSLVEVEKLPWRNYVRVARGDVWGVGRFWRWWYNQRSTYYRVLRWLNTHGLARTPLGDEMSWRHIGIRRRST